MRAISGERALRPSLRLSDENAIGKYAIRRRVGHGRAAREDDGLVIPAALRLEADAAAVEDCQGIGDGELVADGESDEGKSRRAVPVSREYRGIPAALSSRLEIRGRGENALARDIRADPLRMAYRMRTAALDMPISYRSG